jgi:DNA-binding NtrC family response regulator
MSTNEHERILVVDENHIFRETLAQKLRDEGYQVITAETGERAFLTLRDRSRPIDWLYTRARLPGLIDGWILADEYHDSHPDRAAVIAVPEARLSRSGDTLLTQPTLATVLDTVLHATKTDRSKMPAARADAGDQQRAA